MGKAFEFGYTVLVFLTLIGVAVWIGIIYKAEGADKLVEACSPIDFATDGLHNTTTALIGREPVWTLRLKAYLMGGCYYFFSVILTDHEGDGSIRGGIRQ